MRFWMLLGILLSALLLVHGADSEIESSGEQPVVLAGSDLNELLLRLQPALASAAASLSAVTQQAQTAAPQLLDEPVVTRRDWDRFQRMVGNVRNTVRDRMSQQQQQPSIDSDSDRNLQGMDYDYDYDLDGDVADQEEGIEAADVEGEKPLEPESAAVVGERTPVLMRSGYFVPGTRPATAAAAPVPAAAAPRVEEPESPAAASPAPAAAAPTVPAVSVPTFATPAAAAPASSSSLAPISAKTMKLVWANMPAAPENKILAVKAPLGLPASLPLKSSWSFVHQPIMSKAQRLPTIELAPIVQPYAVESTTYTQENIKQPIVEPVYQPYLQRYVQQAHPVVQPIVQRVVQPVVHRQLHSYLETKLEQAPQAATVTKPTQFTSHTNNAIRGADHTPLPLTKKVDDAAAKHA